MARPQAHVPGEEGPPDPDARASAACAASGDA